MSAIASDDFSSHSAQRFESIGSAAQARSRKNVVFMICVLLVHGVAGYALTHMRVIKSANPLVPIEVQFIEEIRKPEEAPKISPPAQVVTNVITPVMPTLDAAVSDAPATVAVSATPVTNIAPQRSDGEISTSPKLVSEVAYVRAPKPRYPSAARSMRLAGTVVLRILIDERGRPAQISVHRSSGHRVLDEAAHDAALDALFKPYVEDGIARQVFVLVPIEFGARSG